MNRNHYEIKLHEGHRYITFPVLTDMGIKNCFTTSDILSGNSDEAKLMSDYEETFRFMDSSQDVRFFTSQVHSDGIKVISSSEEGAPFYAGRFFEDTDGLITGLRNTVLVTRFADCTPVVIIDPEKKVIANLHSGWRGTSKKIFLKAADIMCNQFGSLPQDLTVIIGPCIGYDDFEIQSDVLDIFRGSFGDINGFYRQKDQLHYLLDMQGIIERSLVSYGIKESNIYTADISTFSSELMHSYRRNPKSSGRMIMAVSL